MAASKCNYIVVYESSPQVFASASMETVLKTAPPKNCENDKRTVLFISHFPDEKNVKCFALTEEELQQHQEDIDNKNAEKEAKKKAKEEDGNLTDPPDGG